MNDADCRVSLAEEIARRWDRASIPYAVVHGLHGYPKRIGRDLDLVIHRESVPNAVKTAVDVGREFGFCEALFRWSYWGLYQLALINRKRAISLPLDFLCTTDVWQAKWIRWVDDSTLERLIGSDGRCGPFRVSEEGVFLKACVKPLLCGDLRTIAKEFPLPVRLPETANRCLLEGALGRYGLTLLNSQTFDQLEREFPKAMASLQWRWVRSSPLGAVLSARDTIRRRLRVNLFNASDVILFRATNPETVMASLRDLVPVMKGMFIEIRPVFLKHSVLGRTWGSVLGWRKRPISEFMTYAVVEPSRRRIARDTDCKDSLSIAGGRGAMAPDAVITVQTAARGEKLAGRLQNRILDFLAARYAVPFEGSAASVAKLGKQ